MNSDFSIWEPKKRTWKCHKCNETFRRSLFNVIEDSRCRSCRKRSLRSLKDRFPSLYERIHSDSKTEDINCEEHRILTWKCHRDASHVFESDLYDQIRGWKCPFCSKEDWGRDSSLSRNFPEIAQRYHSTYNVRPLAEVLSTSEVTCWWECIRDKTHAFELPVDLYVSSYLKNGAHYCLICEGYVKTPAPSKSLTGEIIKEDAFPLPREYRLPAHKPPYLINNFPDIASRLHPTRNQGRDINTLHVNSWDQFWWVCRKNDSHLFQRALVLQVKRWVCLCCESEKPKGHATLKDDYPELMAYVDYEYQNPKALESLTVNSQKRLRWRCSKNHIFSESVKKQVDRYTLFDSFSCGVCSGRIPYEEFRADDAESENNHSKANISLARFKEIACEWDTLRNGTLRPETVSSESSLTAYFICPQSHVWKCVISDRTKYGKTCPRCA